jgi:hypothetical protein
LSGSEMESGKFRNPLDAAGILKLALMRELKPEDLDPIALPVLMIRRLARRGISGTLQLSCADSEAAVPILGGMAYLRNPEKIATLRAFTWPEGEYSFDPKPPSPEKRLRFSMGRLVMEGLRTTVRTLSLTGIEEALGERMQMAPAFRMDHSFVLELGLSEPEKRVVRVQMDGERSVESLASRSGLGRQGALQLLLLMTVFETVEWKRIDPSQDGRSADREREGGSRAAADSSAQSARDEAAESGRFFNPRDGAGLLALDLMREPETEAPVALATLLLRRMARRSVAGTLRLHSGDRDAQIPIIAGIAFLKNPEKVAALRAFSWPEGDYSFDATPPDPEKRTRYAMGRIVMEGLRSAIRRFSVDALEEALGERMQLAPLVRKDRGNVLELGLTDPEKRLARLQMDGMRSIEDVAFRSGIGRQTTLQLLVLLIIFDCLEWKKPEITEARTLADDLEKSAVRMEKANHFEALDAHWSLDTDEIERIFDKLMKKIGRGGRWDAVAPEACARMRRRAEEAFAVLSNPTLRAAYRQQQYPNIFYEGATQLVDGQIKSYQFRYDKTGLKEAVKTKHELARAERTAASGPETKPGQSDDEE